MVFKVLSDNTVHIKIIDRKGIEHDTDAPTDLNMNLMELCKAMDLPVEGTCGGMAMCASCHCYVKSDHDLVEMSEDEEAMLDMAFNVEDNSRLACQIYIKEELEGLIIELAPDAQ